MVRIIYDTLIIFPYKSEVKRHKRMLPILLFTYVLPKLNQTGLKQVNRNT